MPGYKKEVLENGEDFNEKLLCCICRLLLRVAVQSTCGHRYCETCVEEKLVASVEDGKQVRCPACSLSGDGEYGVLQKEEIYPDFPARRELKHLRVKCPNEGCPWSGRFLQYIDHEKVCELEPVKCTMTGCGKSFRRGDVPYHLDTDCSMRIVRCLSCGKALPHRRLQEHSSVCNTGRGHSEMTAEQKSRKDVHTSIDMMLAQLSKMFVLRPESSTNQHRDGRERQLEKTLANLEIKVSDTEEELNRMKNLYAVLDKRNETFQEVVAVLNNQLEALSEMISVLERQNRHMQDTIEQQQRQIHAHDQVLTVKDVVLAEQELRIQTLESASHNGILVWKISEFARRRREAISGKTTTFYSLPFYTSFHGYKMCARIYLNGDGMGKGTHLSLFFVVMKGQYDNILRWPFRQKVTFMLVDQGNREHVADAFRPDPTSSSFKKPTHEMNIASGCSLFVSLSLLKNGNNAYVKDDCLFVKVVVDVSDLESV